MVVSFLIIFFSHGISIWLIHRKISFMNPNLPKLRTSSKIEPISSVMYNCVLSACYSNPFPCSWKNGMKYQVLSMLYQKSVLRLNLDSPTINRVYLLKLNPRLLISVSFMWRTKCSLSGTRFFGKNFVFGKQ